MANPATPPALDKTSAEAAERAERQRTYETRRRQRLADDRAKRLKQLDGHKTAIERATNGYAARDREETPVIRIRSEFVRLPSRRDPRPDAPYEQWRNDETRDRPPLTRLIRRPNNALRVFATLLYITQLENEPGKRPRPVVEENNFTGGWADLAGLRNDSSPNRSREHNRRLSRALSQLADEQLISAKAHGTPRRFQGFKLRREDGTDRVYRIPGAQSSPIDVLEIPASFFRAGWHLVLTPPELATFLIIAHHTRVIGTPLAGPGVAVPERVRWEDYGLSNEAYSAWHELEEFGLIASHDPSGRRRGKLTPQQLANPGKSGDTSKLAVRMIYPPVRAPDFSIPAYDVVTRCLGKSPIPPRLSDLSPLP